MKDKTPRGRQPHQPPLQELMRVRQEKYPGLMQRDFAKLLGITRLHLTSVERGRRRASMQLALRWLIVLAPEARLSMFGDLPLVAERLATMKQLQKISPKVLEAARGGDGAAS